LPLLDLFAADFKLDFDEWLASVAENVSTPRIFLAFSR